MIICYGHGNGVKRRGSVTCTFSDAGSDDSGLNSTGTGLSRKPTLMEVFLVGFELRCLFSFLFDIFLFFFSSLRACLFSLLNYGCELSLFILQ